MRLRFGVAGVFSLSSVSLVRQEVGVTSRRRLRDGAGGGAGVCRDLCAVRGPCEG